MVYFLVMYLKIFLNVKYLRINIGVLKRKVKKQCVKMNLDVNIYSILMLEQIALIKTLEMGRNI